MQQTTIPSPIVTRQHFSEMSGLRMGQIRGQADLENLPTFKVGRLTLINVAALLKNELHFMYTPLCTAAQFAEFTGLRVGQVTAQLAEGNLPMREVGKLRLVDVEAIYQQCLAETKKELH